MSAAQEKIYTAQLQAGLGMVEETRTLLTIWQSGVDTAALNQSALESGAFPSMSARRLRNFVAECFAPRYLVEDGAPAILLKNLDAVLTSREREQLMFLYTCRAQAILADFVREVYWPAYAAGRDELSNDDARAFVARANRDGKTTTPWSESTIIRAARYITGCCADFGLLEAGSKSIRRIFPFRIQARAAAILAYDLHFAGIGDNRLVGNEDWALFGLEPDDVLQELKRLALKGALIVQAGGGALHLSWLYKSMDEVVNAITHERL